MTRLLLLAAFLAGCVPGGKEPIYTSKVEGGIGAACAQDGDCHDGRCFTTTWLGFNIDTFGGFCTRDCSSDADCGAGVCLRSPADGNSYCMAPCEQPSHCRDDYLCVPAPRNHCEPVSLYTLDCDPDVVSCTTAGGATGGCLRVALGTGTVGFCRQECFFDSGCNAGDACHYWDDTAEKGKFQGMLCFTAAKTPLGLGASCTSTSECVSGANCVSFDGVNSFCKQLCNPTINVTCQSGAECGSFNPAGPVGICEF